MQNNLFREKSIERISSPEQLHDYMRVTSPRLWMILAAILVLLAGFIVYASTATMENTLTIRATVASYQNSEEDQSNGAGERSTVVSAQVPASMLDSVKTGMKVRILKETGRVSFILESEDEDEANLIIEMDHDQIPLKDGEYDAELVMESTTPISFLWQK